MKFWAIMKILMFSIWAFYFGMLLGHWGATRRYEQSITILTFASVYEHGPVTIAYNESVTVHLGTFIRTGD